MKRFTLSVVMTGVLGLAAYTLVGRAGRRLAAAAAGRGGAAVRAAGAAISRCSGRQPERRAEGGDQGDSGRRAGGARRPPADARVRRELQAEVFAEAPDAQKIAALQQQLLQAQAARLAHQIAVEQKMAQVLTAEQRAKIRERLTQAPSSAGAAWATVTTGCADDCARHGDARR